MIDAIKSKMEVLPPTEHVIESATSLATPNTRILVESAILRAILRAIQRQITPLVTAEAYTAIVRPPCANADPSMYGALIARMAELFTGLKYSVQLQADELHVQFTEEVLVPMHGNLETVIDLLEEHNNRLVGNFARDLSPIIGENAMLRAIARAIVDSPDKWANRNEYTPEHFLEHHKREFGEIMRTCLQYDYWDIGVTVNTPRSTAAQFPRRFEVEMPCFIEAAQWCFGECRQRNILYLINGSGMSDDISANLAAADSIHFVKLKPESTLSRYGL